MQGGTQAWSFCRICRIPELGFELLPHPPYSPDSALSDSCFEFEEITYRKEFVSNDEMTAQINA